MIKYYNFVKMCAPYTQGDTKTIKDILSVMKPKSTYNFNFGGYSQSKKCKLEGLTLAIHLDARQSKIVMLR